MKNSRSLSFLSLKVLLPLGAVIAAALFLSLLRKTEYRIRIDGHAVSMWEGKELLVEAECAGLQAASLRVTVSHDKDASAVLPFARETVSVTDAGGAQKVFPLEHFGFSDCSRKALSFLSIFRVPFSAKILYEDTSFVSSREFLLESLTPREVVFSLTNVEEAKFSFRQGSTSILSVWLRPKYHHDGCLTFLGKEHPFGKPVGKHSRYYLKLITCLILKSLFGSYLVLLLVFFASKSSSRPQQKTTDDLREARSTHTVAAAALALLTLSFAFLVGHFILQEFPHSQDEVAYLFQAKTFSHGLLYLKSLPGDLSRFFEHEFIVNSGKWFGFYVPGNAAVLALGELVRRPGIVNPLLSALGMFLFFVIAREVLSFRLAVVAALLFLSSQFFLLVSGSYLSHSAAMLCTLASVFAYIRLRKNPEAGRYWLLLGASLGFLSLTRPANALLLCVPAAVLLLKKSLVHIRHSFPGALALLIFVVLHLAYNRALTGNPFLTPHEVYAPCDKLGFGSRGTEWGMRFGPPEAFSNLNFHLTSLLDMAFRWPSMLTLAFVPFAFLRKNRKVPFALLAFFLSESALYFFYFGDGTFLGPRYWFEVFWTIPILTVMGVEEVAGLASAGAGRKSAAPYVLLLLLAVYGVSSTVSTLRYFKGYNGMRPMKLPRFDSPALVFVPSEGTWQQYGIFFSLMDPVLNNNSVIFARDQAVHNVPNGLPPLPDERLMKAFPERKYHRFEGGNYLPIETHDAL